MFEEKIAEMNRETATMQPEYIRDKRTYTVDEIQDILGISRPTAYALVKRNLFRSIRIGGQIRISKKSFDEWLDEGGL
jgi:excisionase family DNA binding protein